MLRITDLNRELEIREGRIFQVLMHRLDREIRFLLNGALTLYEFKKFKFQPLILKIVDFTFINEEKEFNNCYEPDIILMIEEENLKRDR